MKSPMLARAAIADRLREIGQLLDLSGGNKFKARAFTRGARVLEQSKAPIDHEHLLALPGIGPALAKQIEELHETGRSDLLESLRKGLPSGVIELSQVGIGLHALQQLHDELGIDTVDDLRRAAEEGRLRAVKGFGEKREKKVLASIAKYETKGPPTLSLAEGLRLADWLIDEIAEIPGVESVHLAGSVARGLELSTSLEIVVEGSADVFDAVAELPRVAAVEGRDEHAIRLRLADGVRVTVLASPSAALGTVLVRATSTEGYWDALGRGAGDPSALGKAFPDEASFYRALDVPFAPAPLRDDLVAPGDAWDDLVTRADLTGFVHTHTTWSDGKGTVEEMALAAEARGATFIAITDHSANAFYAGGLDVDRLKAQWDEIDAVQERVKIRILKGTEADILADGRIDWPDAILERLDVVIASIHNRYKQGEAAMTDRVLRAMKHPTFKIWGHPFGRLVTSRPPIPLRTEDVLDAMAESNAAIEINGDPARLDMEPRWARAALDRGIRVSLSVDAHSMRELDNIRYALLLAQRAGVRRRDLVSFESSRGSLSSEPRTTRAKSP